MHQTLVLKRSDSALKLFGGPFQQTPTYNHLGISRLNSKDFNFRRRSLGGDPPQMSRETLSVCKSRSRRNTFRRCFGSFFGSFFACFVRVFVLNLNFSGAISFRRRAALRISGIGKANLPRTFDTALDLAPPSVTTCSSFCTAVPESLVRNPPPPPKRLPK